MSKRILERKIGEAVDILAPRFGAARADIEKYGKSSFIVVERGHDDIREGGAGYCHGRREFLFYPEFVSDPTRIGEEASHYLHHVVNPVIGEYPNPFERLMFKHSSHLDIRTFWKKRNADEAVGRYGALVYAKEVGARVVPASESNANWEAAWKEADKSSARNRALMYRFMEHRDGYRRAEIIFAQHENSLLHALARLSSDDAIEVYPRLAPLTFYERSILPAADVIAGRSLAIVDMGSRTGIFFGRC